MKRVIRVVAVVGVFGVFTSFTMAPKQADVPAAGAHQTALK